MKNKRIISFITALIIATTVVLSTTISTKAAVSLKNYTHKFTVRCPEMDKKFLGVTTQMAYVNHEITTKLTFHGTREVVLGTLCPAALRWTGTGPARHIGITTSVDIGKTLSTTISQEMGINVGVLPDMLEMSASVGISETAGISLNVVQASAYSFDIDKDDAPGYYNICYLNYVDTYYVDGNDKMTYTRNGSTLKTENNPIKGELATFKKPNGYIDVFCFSYDEIQTGTWIWK